jgi:hypothetical protein
MRAIQGRADALDKLQLVCERAQAAADVRAGFLAADDPIMSLLFSTVGKVRSRTMDAVERVAAWERAVGAGRPFIYQCVLTPVHIAHDDGCCHVGYRRVL